LDVGIGRQASDLGPQTCPSKKPTSEVGRPKSDLFSRLTLARQ